MHVVSWFQKRVWKTNPEATKTRWNPVTTHGVLLSYSTIPLVWVTINPSMEWSLTWHVVKDMDFVVPLWTKYILPYHLQLPEKKQDICQQPISSNLQPCLCVVWYIQARAFPTEEQRAWHKNNQKSVYWSNPLSKHIKCIYIFYISDSYAKKIVFMEEIWLTSWDIITQTPTPKGVYINSPILNCKRGPSFFRLKKLCPDST